MNCTISYTISGCRMRPSVNCHDNFTCAIISLSSPSPPFQDTSECFRLFNGPPGEASTGVNRVVDIFHWLYVLAERILLKNWFSEKMLGYFFWDHIIWYICICTDIYLWWTRNWISFFGIILVKRLYIHNKLIWQYL